jgi:hypothetical protein
MNTRSFNRILMGFTVTLIVGGYATSRGDEKQQALDWLDRYRKVQVLFHDQDVERLRKELAAGTPERAQAWWERTKEIREALDSPEWKATSAWLKEFLKVQAIFTDKQVAQMREELKDAAKTSPRKFKELLADITAYRTKIVHGAAASTQLREQVLAAYQQEAFEAREDARRSTAQAAQIGPSPQPTTNIRTYGAPPPPLINSLDVARWGLMQGFWP